VSEWLQELKRREHKMPDMYFDADVNLSAVPVNLLPLLDATDFKAIEDAVAYNAAGMALFWHFVTSAGVRTSTAVTPTSAGVHDWTDHGTNGMYSLEIPATGGTVNNDTEGYGWFTGSATGVLPWRGPVIGFRAAAINDALCDGGDNLDVNTVQWLGTACATPTVAGVPEVDITHIGGDAQSGTDLKDFADAGYDPATNKVQGVVLVDTITTYTGNTPQTGDSYARIGATGSGLTSLASQASMNTVAGYLDTEIAQIMSDVAAILVDTGTTLQAELDGIQATLGLAGAGLTAVPWNAAWDAEVQSECADALTAYDAATGTDVTTAAGAVTLANGVTHGGVNARLSIDQLLITASDGNPNILLTGSGAADGLSFTRSGAGGVFDTEFAAALQQEAADALTAYDPPTNAEMVARTLVAADYATATAVDALPTNAELATALGTADDAVLAQVALVKADTAAILIDTAEIGLAGAGLTVLATQASVNTIDDFLDTEVAVILAAVDTEVAAIKAKTDTIPVSPAAVGDIPTAAQNATAVLTTQMTESYRAAFTAPTLAQAAFETIGHLGESSISGVTKTVKRVDGVTTAKTFTLNDATTPTSITEAT
jgi:hypothetical protein